MQQTGFVADTRLQIVDSVEYHLKTIAFCVLQYKFLMHHDFFWQM